MVDLEKIKKLTEAPDEELRIKGLQYLRGVSNDAVFDILISALGDDSWRVRKAGVDVLSGMEDHTRIMPRLVACLRSEDNAGLRNSSVEVLEKIGAEAVDLLLDFIDDGDHDLRKLVLDVLGNIGDPRVTPYLIKSLSDPDENVKSSAAENLGKIGSDEAVKSLLEVLKSSDLLLQFSALEALSRIGTSIPSEVIVPLLNNPVLKKAAVDVLGKSQDVKSLPHLLEGLESRSRSTRESALVSIVGLVESLPDKIREEASLIINKKKGSLTEFVLPCLESGDKDITASALKVLGWLKSVESIPEILQLAGDEFLIGMVEEIIMDFGPACEEKLIASYNKVSDDIKPFVCHILGEIHSVNAIDLLVDAMGSPVGHIRHSSALSLGKIGNKTSIPLIVPLLDDEYEDVQVAAVQAISMLWESDKESVSKVLSLGIASESINIRRNSTRIMALIGDKDSVDIALTALKDEDPVVRKDAVEALAAIGGEETVRHIVLALSDENRDVRISAAGHLGKMGFKEEGLRPLVSSLEDEDIWVRSAAVKGVAELGGKDAASCVAEMLNDEVGLVVISALQALGTLALSEYGPVMMEALESADLEVVKTAVESLAFWDDQRYVDRIIELLDSENWEIKVAAVKVLGQKKIKGYRELLSDTYEVEKDEFVKSAIEEILDAT